MDRMTQVALNSMRIFASGQKITASNLANQNTLGFRADLGNNVGSVYLHSEQGMDDRVFASRGGGGIDTKAGTLIPTDRPLDVSVDGDGFMAGVAADGTNVLTRRGDLTVGLDGILRNGEKVAILGDTGQISVPPYDRIQVANDGTISIIPQGSEPGTPPVPVSRIQLIAANAADLKKGLDGILRTKDGQIPPPDANVRVSSNFLETSNVNTVEAMIDMISASRSYEMTVKMLSTAKDLDSETAKLMRSS